MKTYSILGNERDILSHEGGALKPELAALGALKPQFSAHEEAGVMDVHAVKLEVVLERKRLQKLAKAFKLVRTIGFADKVNYNVGAT